MDAWRKIPCQGNTLEEEEEDECFQKKKWAAEDKGKGTQIVRVYKKNGRWNNW